MSTAPSDQTLPPAHPFAAHQHQLRERLLALLAPLVTPLQADVKTALAGESKLLSDTEEAKVPSGVWSLLTLLLSHYLAPDIDLLVASSVALSLECYVCAIDLLDDVMDEDQTPTLLDLGIPRALSASDALRALASQSLLSLQSRSAPLVLSLLETLTLSSLAVAAGQTDDVLAEHRPTETMSFEMCIAIARAKAGSIMQLACRLAAVCARVSDAQYQRLSAMGEYLGIAHQLDNDAHDLYDLLYPKPEHTAVGKSDLFRGKKTLPVVLAAQETAFEDGTSLSDERYRAALYTGIVQTWAISQLYRYRARVLFEQMESEVQTDASLLRRLFHF